MPLASASLVRHGLDDSSSPTDTRHEFLTLGLDLLASRRVSQPGSSDFPFRPRRQDDSQKSLETKRLSSYSVQYVLFFNKSPRASVKLCHSSQYAVNITLRGTLHRSLGTVQQLLSARVTVPGVALMPTEQLMCVQARHLLSFDAVVAHFTSLGPTGDANSLVRSDAVILSSLTNELFLRNLVLNSG